MEERPEPDRLAGCFARLARVEQAVVVDGRAAWSVEPVLLLTRHMYMDDTVARGSLKPLTVDTTSL